MYDNDTDYSNLSMHREYCASIIKCLKQLLVIKKTYKISNTQLVSPKELHEEKLKRFILPYDENEKCSVCYEPTQEETICGHLLCFRCRCKIIKKTKRCPICRNKCLDIYCEDNDNPSDSD